MTDDKDNKLSPWLLGMLLAFLCVSTQAQDDEASRLEQIQLQQVQQIQQLNGNGRSNQSASPRPPISAEFLDQPSKKAPSQSENQPVGALPEAPPPPAGLADSQLQSLIHSETQEALDEAAFRSAMRDAFPLTPEQVLRLRGRYEENELAVSSTAGAPPRPTATSQFVNLAPGSTPPVIRLSQGFVSSLVFLDSTGAPWPITAYDLGNPTAFNIQWDKTSNTMMVQALDLYTYGNLAVRLKGLTTPVMLTLIPGQKAVDYRVDLRIEGRGPNAQTTFEGTYLPPSADPILLKVLDGVPPVGSRRLEVFGGEAEVWEKCDKLYVRTRLTILSPGWLATMSSADGMKAYQLQRTPVILVSQYGKVSHLKIEGL